MAKKKEVIEPIQERQEKPKKQLKEFVLRDDFPPKKKGEKILVSKGGEQLLKSKNLI